jgi:NADH-quinone oxidoreductase subunit J
MGGARVVRGFKDAYLPLRAGGGTAGAIGSSLFRVWVLPFEVLSVPLLAALIGAIVLSRTDVGPARRPEPSVDRAEREPDEREPDGPEGDGPGRDEQRQEDA